MGGFRENGEGGCLQGDFTTSNFNFNITNSDIAIITSDAYYSANNFGKFYKFHNSHITVSLTMIILRTLEGDLYLKYVKKTANYDNVVQ